MAEQQEPAGPGGPDGRLLPCALLVVLAVQLAVWGSFLVPTRIGGVLVPVSWAVAVMGNLALGLVGGRCAGRLGAALPGVVWTAVALALGTRRDEGDLVVTGNTAGLVFLVSGALTSAAAYALAVGGRRVRTSAGQPDGS